MARTLKQPATRKSRKPARGAHTEDFEAQPVPRRKASVKPLEPLTENQQRYDSSIRTNRITFGIGPAGTGKSWYACALAAEMLENNLIEKIVLCRPAVEAEEELGFLPGLMEEKFEPYIRPLRDAFEERLGGGKTDYLLKNKVIEARPLAYLRGSTLKNAVVILDEAQNTTPGQMKMFLSRIGTGATFIINGDPTQQDISGPSGLLDGIDTVRNVNGVQIVRFTEDDIVRDDICMDIIRAYSDRKKSKTP